MKFLEFENKVKCWIQNNQIKWCFVLFGIGILLGLFANILLHGATRQGLVMCFSYGFLFIFIEITAGGSGID